MQNYNFKSTKKSTKKCLRNDPSKRLLGLKFKSNNSIKTKCLKHVAKHVLPILQK